MSEQLREKIAKIVWSVVDWERYQNHRGCTNEGLSPEKAIAQILQAIEEAGYICVGEETVDMIMERDEGI